MKLKIPCIVLLGLIFLFECVACETASPIEEMIDETKMPLNLSSSAFSEGEDIPRKHTCDGDDLSPPLAWSGIPDEAQSLVLIVDDPDAPAGTFVHWVLYDLSPIATSLPEGVKGLGTDGTNDFRTRGYRGPCPPRGSTHRYFFKLYAVGVMLNLESGATKRDIEEAMQGHIVAEGQLVGNYGR